MEYVSDFPDEILSKQDCKKVKNNVTFGNDKILTSKGFRPSYGIAQGKVTKIIKIPLKNLQDAIVKISNSSENKMKTEFFKKI